MNTVCHVLCLEDQHTDNSCHDRSIFDLLCLLLCGQEAALSESCRHKHDVDIRDAATRSKTLETSRSAIVRHTLAPVKG